MTPDACMELGPQCLLHGELNSLQVTLVVLTMAWINCVNIHFQWYFQVLWGTYQSSAAPSKIVLFYKCQVHRSVLSTLHHLKEHGHLHLDNCMLRLQSIDLNRTLDSQFKCSHLHLDIYVQLSQFQGESIYRIFLLYKYSFTWQQIFCSLLAVFCCFQLEVKTNHNCEHCHTKHSIPAEETRASEFYTSNLQL